VLDQKRGSGFG
jgi:hypothetical protein